MKHRSIFNTFLFVCVIVAAGVFAPHVESEFAFTRKLETINIIPGEITGAGWSNTRALYEQDVSESGIFQSFTKHNSAYPQSGNNDSSSEVKEVIESTWEENDNAAIPDTNVNESGTTSDGVPPPLEQVENALEESSSEQTETVDDVVPTESLDPVESVDVPEPISVRSVDDGIFGFFAQMRGLFPFAQESITTPSSEGTIVNVEPIPSDQTEIPIEGTVEEDLVSEVNEENVDDEVIEPTEIGSDVVVNEPELSPLIFSDFSIPSLSSGQFISNVQLRLSFGALVQNDVSHAPISIEYTFGDEWLEAGSIVLDGEVSNALNGGYFLFALPTLTDATQFETLKVRIRYDGELSGEEALYIDALWLELDTETFDRNLLRERLQPEAFGKLDLPRFHALISDTLDFTRTDDPVFVLRYESQRNAAIRFLRNLIGRDLADIQSITFIRKGVGIVPITPVVDTTVDGLWTIQIPEEVQDDLEPGTYTIEMQINEGGKVFTDSFDFQWGLLALNPDKTEYESGETATIALAALSPNGNTLCEANLSMYIIDPNEFIYRTPVTPSGLCNGNNVIDVPDYTTVFIPTVPGEYEMYLEHIGAQGEVLSHTKDTFRVIEVQPISIKREGQTRIYPLAPYTMSLTVSSEDAYEGVLTERVPRDFTIIGTDGTLTEGDETNELAWQLNLAPGESRTVTYEYDAPDISPFLYTLGPATLSNVQTLRVLETIEDEAPVMDEVIATPSTTPEVVPEPSLDIPSEDTEEVVVPVPVDLQIVEPVEEKVPQFTQPAEGTPVENDFELIPSVEPVVVEALTETISDTFTEHRAWQIASDATGSMILFWTSGASVPAGWTCISCTATSTFYQRFPLGGSTYGTTGGTTTQTHTADGAVNATTVANAENRAGNFVSIVSHSHTYTPTIGSTTTLPAYRQLRVIQSNSAGDPGLIPAGAILIFDGSLPSGWAAYTALNDRYPRGENTIVSAGSNTHIHSVGGSTSAANGTSYDSRTGGTQRTAAADTHTHTVSTSTPPVNHEPPYLQVVFATSSTATATPLSSISMWSDTPPAGWLNRSADAAAPFYNRFIKGGATYGTMGGSDTHTHDAMSGTTGAAIGTDNARQGTAGAANTHTHGVDISNFSTATHTPPYVSVIFAKYYGLVPIYTQSAYRWYTNINSSDVTDAWPTSTEDVAENEAIDESFTPLKNGDVLRLRLQLNVSNSTTTGEDFKLQYGTTTDVCTAVSSWTDVGSATSSALWIGYNNAGPSDGATLASAVLTGTDVLETYEEQNPTSVLPNSIGIDQDGEWDFVLKQNNATPNTNFCFRMVESDGTELFAYTNYPMLITNQSPYAASLDILFDNEKVATTTPYFEFFTSDSENDDLTYQIQIDDDYTFSTVNVDRNTASNPTQFANITTPSDKDPYSDGEVIRFTLPSASALTNGSTYYWRVRAHDPAGSNGWGSWSTIRSTTIDTSITTSAWFQTMEEQFDTDTLTGTDALSSDRIDLKAGSTTGTTTSSQVDFLDGTVGNAWGSLSWTDTETVGDIKYRVEYFDESIQEWSFVPDTDLSGNSAGFDVSPVSLLSLDTNTYRLIRINAIFTNSGGSPILYDWTVNWGYRIETVTQNSPFPNEKVGTTTPTFEFTTTDPQNDGLVYSIEWSTSYNFSPSTTRSSNTHSGFQNVDNGGNLSPFTSGDTIQFTVQASDALVNGTTYWWRVRARDPLGSDQYSLYTEPRSFTVDTSVTVSTWFETTQSQFDTNILSGTISLGAGSVTVATTSSESLIVYAEGVVTTPRYREWNGITWGSEASALDVGASINWIVTRSSPLQNEYITGTLGTDGDINLQVFTNGSWGYLEEVTATVPNAAMRGFDIAYEVTSGDAVAVYCDGDADPSYQIWDGSSWTSGGPIGLTSGNTCGWVKLISDPTSDEIIAITRDVSGISYEAQVWNGSSWGNSATWGSMQNTQTTHEGIAATYEDSGNQAVVAVSNGTNSSFSWRAWNGASWTGAATVALGDDFEAGTIVADDGSDNLALCYVDQDNDIGAVRWTGAGWVGMTELETTSGATVFNDRPVDCAFEVGGSRDGYILVAYSDATNVRYRSWNGATWAVEASVSTIQDSPRIQLRRTGANLIQLSAFDNTNDRYDYSYWNGTAWSVQQTLETNASVSATPFKEPFMNAIRKPGVIGSAVVSPGINFYDGAGPYWQQLSWTDSEPGGSTILYQMEYYDGDSWELVPDSLIPDNSIGTSTGPMDLTNVLPVSTYNELRPIANLTCNLGTCPSLSDWTVTWAAGINVSGTIQGYDQSTNVNSGTVAVALNGVLQVGKTGTIAGGAWSISNVNAAPGDVVTVFVNGALDSAEAVAIGRYDGVGDISGMTLYERHLTLGSDDATTTPFTNADIGLYDMTNDEDLFFDTLGTALTMCADVGCGDTELLIKSSSTYRPQGSLSTHDIEINGTFAPEGNTSYISGSWDNNGTSTNATSTMVFTATSTSETLDETGAVSPSFYNLTFGTTTGAGAWTLATPLDINNTFVIERGTVNREGIAFTIAGNLTINANGIISGIGSTTFDGSGTSIVTDATASVQNIGNVIVDGTSKTIQLGNRSKVQSLTIGADDIFDVSTSNYGLTVLSNFLNGNTFVARSGTTTFAGTTTNLTITAGGDSFYNLAFTGVDGAWSFTETDLAILSNLTIATGTVTMPTGTTTVAGSFINTGTFAHNNATVVMNASTARSITQSGTTFTNAFYNLRFAGSGSWVFTEANATTSNDLRIAQGTVTFPSNTLSVGGNFANTGGTFVHNNGTVRFPGAATRSIDANASFYNILFTGSGTSSFVDANVTSVEDVTIRGGAVTLPSGTFTIGGSFTNQGTFAHNSGSVLFNSNDTGETISLGSSSLNGATFNNTGGGWTITEDATTTNEFTLTNANTFTLAGGTTLSVGGTFQNSVGGASTTWTGSTLSLEAGAYTLNAKTNFGDLYETLRVKASTDIKMWNSSAATYAIDPTGSLYSQDHAGVDGDLYIFGSYERTTGTEYWDHAIDFDGAGLASSSRQVDVRFADGANATFATSTLSIVGSASGTTTVRNQGTGSYTLFVNGGTTTLQYYDFGDLGSSGVTLGGAGVVTNLSNGRFSPVVNAGTGLSVSSTMIDQNPGMQIFAVEFSTTSAISATNVTQNGGAPTSYWWFRESSGNIDGEAFDADTGDPGSIRWDDSSLSVTVSGTIYQSDGASVLGAPTCGAGTPVRIVVENGGTYDGACDGSGAYSIPNVVIVGDPTLTVFLNGAAGSEKAVTVTKTPTADIAGLDLIAGRVIVRHEDVDAMTIEDMASYDAADDIDIPFTAATGTPNSLTVFADTALHVWATSTFTPGGTIALQSGGSGASYDGSLYLGDASTFTGAGTTTYSLGGSFVQGIGATFVPASSTLLFTATTSGKGIVSASGESIALHDLTFSGIGGGWNLTGNMTSTGDLALATGTLTGTGDVMLLDGSIYGEGLLSLGAGTTTLAVTNTLGGSQPWTFANLVLGTGSQTGTTTKATNATTTILGRLTIGTGHSFQVFGSTIDLQGGGTVFVENGSFLEGTSTVRYSGTANSNVISTNYHNLSIHALGGTPTYTGTGLGIMVLGDLTIGGVASTTFTLDASDPAMDVNGAVLVTSNGTLIGSGTGAFTIGGSWNNDGTFIGSNGTVTFDGSGTHTIAAGTSSFSNLRIQGLGDFTVSEHATTTGTMTLTQANAFTVDTGVSFAVGGTFQNRIGGGATTWTSATLYLYGGGNYEINASTTSDTYDRLAVGAGTQIRMWNSDALVPDISSTASLYSQDHAGMSGDLNIYGSYVKTSGNDHWSYATNFDGTSLSGSERSVDVRIVGGGSVLYTGGGLSVIGAPLATTTIQNQGSGAYSFRIGGTASTTMSYYSIFDTDVSGLTFYGTPNVWNLSNGNFTVGVASGTALTVGGTVITQNPAKTFTNNNFSTSTTGLAFNVTATGTTASSWRFTNHTGAIDGELYDVDPDGDPGYIVWDDSAQSLTISGRVYSDEGTTVSTSTCDGSTNNIHLRVQGLTSYSTNCNASTGLYTIPGITYSPGDSFVVYIDGESEKAATISEDPVTNINNMDIYANRVIVRHEGADPLTIQDMSVWDSSDDGDIPFTAVDGTPDTLTLPANRKLLVWTGKEFEPRGNVTVTGGGSGLAHDGTLELQANAIFDATGTETHTVGGSMVLGNGATFDDESSTFIFTTSGATRTIDTNDQSFYNLSLNGSGSWMVTNAYLDVGNDLTITQGALTLPTGTTTVTGSFLNTGGSFIQNGGSMRFTSAAAETIRVNGSSFGTTTFAGSGSWTYLDTNATTTNDLTIMSGTVTAASGTLTIGGNFVNDGTFTHNNGTIRMTSSVASTTIDAGVSDLSNVTIAGTGTFVFTEPSQALRGSLRFLSGTTTLPTTTISIGGSFVSAGGAFVHSTGTVLMNSSDGGETIDPGASTFNHLTIAAPTGGYTITGNATTTGNFSLTSASTFTLQNGQTLGIQGIFTNLVGGASTTWTGTTVQLLSGAGYTVNTKIAGGDEYNRIILGNNTDLRFWNSSATTTLNDALSSLYSQDNAGIDGELYIYGNYSRTTGADYWSAATDFDGAAVASRAVVVRHASGATSTFSGGTLDIIGTATATTTITNQGSGTYAWQVTGGTLNAQYYAVRNIDASGLVLSGETSITSLSNGDFELAVNGGALITVSSTTVNYNASAVITGLRFATTSAIAGVNIALVGGTAAAWTLTSHLGNLDGEAFDDDGIDACGSIRWDDSSCLLTQQSSYRWRRDDGGEGVPSSEWFDGSWSKRKRITVSNADATTYTNAVVEVTVPFDSDMQTDFDDLRVTDASGTTTLSFMREVYSASTEATLWVEVPTLLASSDTVIYLYFGNGAATYGGVGTTTFSVYDDLEDANITEYSGDTTYFTADTGLAYQGTYALEATDPFDFTVNTLYRTNVTVAQGQTIRFLQYIDTNGSAASDETCTLFGVQSAGSNYAVCLEQYGIDRLSIAENVTSNDTSGTVHASTTLTYETGWYEVEIDWATDDSISVFMYKDDVLVATTSTTDTSYSTGGIGFAFWGQHGSWDLYTSRVLMATEPTVTLGFEQVSGGASWAAALNTPITGVDSGTIVRPRFLIENSGLQVVDQYQLLYAGKGVAPSCESVGAGSYVPVPPQSSCGTSSLCMQTSSHFVDKASTTDILGGNGTFAQGQIIEDPSNMTDSITVPNQSYTELEYAIAVTVNATDPQYCLRVSDNGTSIDSYTKVAELGLVFEPNITSVNFNDGLDITLLPGTTTRIVATSTVSDQNGFGDIVAATTTMYRSGVGESCAANTNNCYIAGPSQCSYVNCSGNSCDIVCTSDFFYHADHTATGTFGGETWRAMLTVQDQSGLVATATAPSIDLLTLRALDVDELINYGALEVNEDTGSYNATTTFENIGNDPIDVAVEGTNLTDGVSSNIPVNEQIFATSTFTYSACVYCTQLSTSTTNYELDLSKPASTTPAVTDYVYWGIEIPFGISAAPHQGTNVFYAIGD